MGALSAIVLAATLLLIQSADGQERVGGPVPSVCPALIAWLDAWEGVAHITVESFKLTDSRGYDISTPRYELNYFEYLLNARIPWELQSEILTFSPDSSYALDSWIFGVAADSLGLFSARDPDTMVALVDVRAGTATVVLSGGTPLTVDLACWPSRTSFVIAGAAQNDAVGGFHLMIWQYDLAADTVLTFQGPYLERGTPWGPGNSCVEGRFPTIRR